jgi:hypothetical protein
VARRSPDEFDDVLKLGSGELGQHLIDATLMRDAIAVSDTLQRRISAHPVDEERLRSDSS